MALSGSSVVRLILRQSYLDQTVLNVIHVVPIAGATGVTVGDVCEGWWNHIKTATRPAFPNLAGFVFKSVEGEDELTPHDFGSYVIPVGESNGQNDVAGTLMPSSNASSVKLVVPNRLTRPGGKRFNNLSEDQVTNQNLSADLLSRMNTMMLQWINNFTAADAGSTVFSPVVYGYGRPAAGSPTANPISSFVISPYASTQVSRKIGRGI